MNVSEFVQRLFLCYGFLPYRGGQTQGLARYSSSDQVDQSVREADVRKDLAEHFAKKTVFRIHWPDCPSAADLGIVEGAEAPPCAHCSQACARICLSEPGHVQLEEVGFVPQLPGQPSLPPESSYQPWCSNAADHPFSCLAEVGPPFGSAEELFPPLMECRSPEQMEVNVKKGRGRGRGRPRDCSPKRRRKAQPSDPNAPVARRGRAKKDKQPASPKEKQVGCDQCGRMFADRSSLACHQRTHSGEKPFLCSHCPKSFTHSGDRNCHERTHTGERPYACRHCPKAFAHLSTRVTHERTHTGEKPYQCHLCPKAFVHAGDRNCHERRHKNSDGKRRKGIENKSVC